MTRRIVNTVILIFVLPLITAVAPASARNKILVMGDSISAAYGIQREAGWVALLEQRLNELNRPWRVVNASVSGETTGGGLARLPAALSAHDPQIVIIELGGNDALRGYPIANIRNNLEQMVSVAQQTDRRVLLLGIRMPPNYGPRYTDAIAALYDDVAAQRGVALVPFLMQKVALQPELMQDDGIHPTADAQPMLLDAVWPLLSSLLDG